MFRCIPGVCTCVYVCVCFEHTAVPPARLVLPPLPLSGLDESDRLISDILTPDRASAISCLARSLSCLRRSASRSCKNNAGTHTHTDKTVGE